MQQQAGTVERISSRWGIPEYDQGFTPIPESVLRYHAQLGVTGHLFAVVIHLASFKWERDNSAAYPSYETLAQRVGVTKSYLSKLIHRLEGSGMIVTTRRTTAGGRIVRTEYSLEPFARACHRLMAEARDGFLKETVGFPPGNPEGFPQDTNEQSVQRTSKYEKNPPTPQRPASPPAGGRKMANPSSERIVTTEERLKGIRLRPTERSQRTRAYARLLQENSEQEITDCMEKCAAVFTIWGPGTVGKHIAESRAGVLHGFGARSPASTQRELEQVCAPYEARVIRPAPYRGDEVSAAPIRALLPSLAKDWDPEVDRER
jgi:AraC-like DNA-binding protein